MMFTCVTPGCDQPGHYHPAMAASRKSPARGSRSKKHAQALVRDKKGRRYSHVPGPSPWRNTTPWSSASNRYSAVGRPSL